MSNKPRLASKQDLSELERLQQIYSGDKSLERSHKFATWVFTSMAIVLTLGTVLGGLKFEDLNETSQYFLRIASALTALALVCATMALAPRSPSVKGRLWRRIRPGFWSLAELRSALNAQVDASRKWSRFSGFFFAVALGVAGVGPLACAPEPEPVGPPHTELTYKIEAKGLQATAAIFGLEPGSYVTLEASFGPAIEGPTPKAGTVADAEGKASLEIQVQELPAAADQVDLEIRSAPKTNQAVPFDSRMLKPISRQQIPLRNPESEG